MFETIAGFFRTSAAGIIDVIGRIAKTQIRLRAVQKPIYIGGNRRIAAQKAVIAEEPEIAGTADRLFLRFGNHILGLTGVCGLPAFARMHLRVFRVRLQAGNRPGFDSIR